MTGECTLEVGMRGVFRRTLIFCNQLVLGIGSA
jgi:hypothetical protein